MRKKSLSCAVAGLLLVVLALPGAATNYYVSTTGNNSNDGLTPETAWASIDYADKNNKLQAGDTVNVLQGTYNISDSNPGEGAGYGIYLRNCSGVTYKAVGDVKLVGAGSDLGDVVILADKVDNITIDGFKIENASSGIKLNYARNTEVKNCQLAVGKLHGITWDDYGIQVFNGWGGNGDTYNLIHHNLIVVGGAMNFGTSENPVWGGGMGINVTIGRYDRIYNNTVVNANSAAIAFSWCDATNEARNNIVYSTIQGMPWNSALMGNDTITHSYNSYYNVGWVYSSGTTLAPNDTSEVDPLFVNPTGWIDGDYRLQSGSAMIDSGVNVGLAYNGAAPDRGAFEAAAVPEPSSICGLIFGLVASAGAIRRRK